MTLRQMEYFLAVVEEGSFTRAAERLFVSQPALSKQLRVLERQLGFRLFERVHSGVVLTRQGEALLPIVRDLLERWTSGVESARAAAPAGTLVIGMQTAVGRGLQQEALRRFRTAMPGWEVSLRLVRSSSSTPSRRSSCRIARDSGGCAIPSRRAARPKCSSSATATKYRNSRVSIAPRYPRSIPVRYRRCGGGSPA